MKFLLIAYDGKDDGAKNRRTNIRPTHLDSIMKRKIAGEIEVGGGILDEEGNMIGSMCVFEFPNREALNNYLESEPYVTEQVWQEITVLPFNRVI